MDRWKDIIVATLLVGAMVTLFREADRTRDLDLAYVAGFAAALAGDAITRIRRGI